MSSKHPPVWRKPAAPARLPLTERMKVSVPGDPRRFMAGNRWNYYTCTTCGTHYVTVELAHGATPGILRCADRVLLSPKGKPERAKCAGTMLSAWYTNPATWPDDVPRVAHGEWYSPSVPEVRQLQKRRSPLLDHVAQGGLLLRRAQLVHPFPSSTSSDATDQG
jgi:hypothetical protein